MNNVGHELFSKTLVNGPVFVNFARLPSIVVVMALGTVIANAHLRVVALLAVVDRRHQHVAGFIAVGSRVALGAVQHAMVLMAEPSVGEPAGGDVSLFVNGQAVLAAFAPLFIVAVRAVVLPLLADRLQLLLGEKFGLERVKVFLDPLPLLAVGPFAENALVYQSIIACRLVGDDGVAEHKLQ